MKERVFHGVKSLNLVSGGTITINEDGTIEGATSAEQKGHTLTIGGGCNDGGSQVMSMNIGSVSGSGCNMTFFNNSGAYVMNQGSIISNVGSSGTTTIIQGSGSGSRGSGSVTGTPNIAIINGRRIDLNRLDEIAVPEQSKGEQTTVYKLGDDCLLSSIKVGGSVTLMPIPFKFSDTSLLSVHVSGNGEIVLNPAIRFNGLNILVSGNGDLQGDDVVCDTAVINVSGVGDVHGLHIEKSGVVNVSGKGDVLISASYPTRVVKTESGCGSAKVTYKR